jgi:hypothetical protein
MFPGAAPVAGTNVANESAIPLVIRVVEPAGRFERFYPSRPGTTITVDTVGLEGNAAAAAITVLDTRCAVIQTLEESFDDGGLVTVGPDLFVRFDSSAVVHVGDENDLAMSDCATAATAVKAP